MSEVLWAEHSFRASATLLDESREIHEPLDKMYLERSKQNEPVCP